MIKISLLAAITSLLFIHSTCKQSSPIVTDRSEKQVGGGCDGCEIMYVDMPSNISWSGSLTSPSEAGERLEISGTVYDKTGSVPQSGIIIYLYQTNAAGLYAPAPNQNHASRRHGGLRGWVKTNEQGQYKFSTIIPGAYPDSTLPAHIHPTIKENGKTAYYIDDYVFKGFYKVDENYIRKQELRAGSGIIEIKKQNNMWTGKRDLYLGLNIPNY
jgi:protocatechuate 3,4-dioxygenase beta subunit